MVWVPGGVYWRGHDTGSHRDALPWHLVEVDGFCMAATTVTNEQFETFVRATGYVTVAERAPKAEDFPGAPANTPSRSTSTMKAAWAEAGRPP